jgi:hypothetical protein
MVLIKPGMLVWFLRVGFCSLVLNGRALKKVWFGSVPLKIILGMVRYGCGSGFKQFQPVVWNWFVLG